MTKVRVYEVARELGLENRDLMQRMATLGIQVRNHMSALESGEADRLRHALSKKSDARVVEERIRPTVVRRRASAKRAPEAPNETAAPATNGSTSNLAAQSKAADAAAPNSTRPAEASTSKADSKPVHTASLAQPEAPKPGTAASAQGRLSEGANASRGSATSVRTSKTTGAQAASASTQQTPPPPVQNAGAEPAPAETVAVAAVKSHGAEAPPPAPAYDPSEAPPPSVRFAHANLPPGVVARGNVVARGVEPLSQSVRNRIVSEHAARRPETPRRRELGRAALGPAARPQARHGRKRAPAAGKKGKQTEITVPSAQKRLIRIEDNVQLQILAQRMSLKATDVLMKLMQLGVSGVHINSALDTDTAKILASEFGYEVENVAQTDEELVEAARGEVDDREEDRQPRAPVVTVMGHVDHGKTSLLDKIRSSDVAQGESGGITQHIGAYRVDTSGGAVVFLDTPGHEAFTAMRARGAQVTDVVVLVVAADDGVMPQTREAINHAKEAKVPVVVAINKIDKADAQPEQVKSALSAEGLTPEEWGGDAIFVPCSAATGEGVDKLLESILLQSEVLELAANPTLPASGVVLESYLDKGRGPVANVLIQTGTLSTGDHAVAGSAWGRVRALTDDRGRPQKTAGASTPVEVLGLSEMPSAGESFYIVTDQKKAQEIAESRSRAQSQRSPASAPRGLDQVYQMMQAGDVQELKLVVKADVQGSIEALNKAFTELSTEKVKVSVIHSGVGGITENDVLLASASNATIIGFNVRPAGQAGAAAKNEAVDLRMYGVIYEAVEEIKKAMTGLLAPKLVDKELGKAEVRQVFSAPKIGTVAGSYILEGRVVRNAKARLVRDSIQVWEGEVASLRRFKDDVKEVAAGYECGIRLEGYRDIREGDIIEAYQVEEVAAALDD